LLAPVKFLRVKWVSILLLPWR